MPPLIMFDLDQTLAESKQALAPHMADLLARLLKETKVAVISGGGLPQFLKQVVEQLPPNANLSRLYLLPTSGAALYEWRGGEWSRVYEEKLSEQDAERIKEAVRTVAKETGLIDFSTPAYGEQAWDPDKSKRRLLQRALTKCLPEYSVCLPDFEVGMGGATSVDITKKGVDKAYGIEKISEHLAIPIAEMLYVGDQLEPGGNDEAATRTAIKTHAVTSPSDTAFFIASLLPR